MKQTYLFLKVKERFLVFPVFFVTRECIRISSPRGFNEGSNCEMRERRKKNFKLLIAKFNKKERILCNIL